MAPDGPEPTCIQAVNRPKPATPEVYAVPGRARFSPGELGPRRRSLVWLGVGVPAPMTVMRRGPRRGRPCDLLNGVALWRRKSKAAKPSGDAVRGKAAIRRAVTCSRSTMRRYRTSFKDSQFLLGCPPGRGSGTRRESSRGVGSDPPAGWRVPAVPGHISGTVA
jgi:hypothetical protein